MGYDMSFGNETEAIEAKDEPILEFAAETGEFPQLEAL